MKNKFFIACLGVIFSLILVFNVQASKSKEKYFSDALAIMAEVTISTKSTGCDNQVQQYCYPGGPGEADSCKWGPEPGITCNPFEDTTPIIVAPK